MGWLVRHRISLLLLALGLVGFGVVSGKRLVRQSSDPHFVLLADAWLESRLDIDPQKRKGDDWATVEYVRLDDGREVRGRRLRTRRAFRIAGGDEVPLGEIDRSLGKRFYVSFPPFPALLYLPQAAIWGHRANDVPAAVFLAALCLPLMFLVLRRLSSIGASARTPGQDAWLAVALGFGTVLFFAGVQGRVWFTAHVVGVALTLCYLLCALGARRPVLAGLCLGCMAMTRTPTAFLFPLFALEAWRVYGARSEAGGRRGARADGDASGLDEDGAADDDGPAGGDGDAGHAEGDAGGRDWRGFVRACAAFAAPVVVIAIAAMWHNQVRFGALTEFGHTYLNVRQQARMETTGLFSYEYLSRNLAVALALLPSFSSQPPYVSISGHGLALWFTSPFLLWLLWPRLRDARGRAVWRALVISAAAVALPTLLYQNSGWFQFGYRFSLDYTALLVALVAVGGKPLGWGFRTLVVVAIAINLFGAVTFGQDYRYYRTDQAAYRTVIAH